MPSSAYIRIIREQLQLAVFKAGFPTNVVEVPSVPPPAFPEIEIGPILAAALISLSTQYEREPLYFYFSNVSH